MSYKKPTIVEIYAEFHLVPGMFPAEKMLDVAHFLKGQGLQRLEILSALPAMPVIGPEPPRLQGRIRVWLGDQKLIQLSEDLVVVNLVGDYAGWGDFKRLVQQARDAIGRENGLFPPVESISLQAIDRFVVPAVGYDFGRYVSCDGQVVPKWYAGSKQQLDLDLGQGVLLIDRVNRQVHVKVRRRGGDDVTIEFRIQSHRMLENQSIDELLETLHDESNEMFEAIITNTTRNEVMQGVKP